MCQVLQSDLVWTHKWPFQGLSDLHLGNHQAKNRLFTDCHKVLATPNVYIYIYTVYTF